MNQFVQIHRNFLLISILNLYCHSWSMKFKQDQIFAFIFLCHTSNYMKFVLMSSVIFFPFPLTTPFVQISPPSNIFWISDQSPLLLFSELFQLVNFSYIQETVWSFIVGACFDGVHWKANSIFLFKIKSAASMESQIYIFLCYQLISLKSWK